MERNQLQQAGRRGNVSIQTTPSSKWISTVAAYGVGQHVWLEMVSKKKLQRMRNVYNNWKL